MLSSIIPTPVSSLATQFGHEQIQIDCQPSLSQPSKQVNIFRVFFLEIFENYQKITDIFQEIYIAR